MVDEMRTDPENKICAARPRWRLAAPIVLCALLSACAVGPDYRRPALDVGAAYKETGVALDGAAAVAGENKAINAGWVLARPDDSALRGDWWALYDDPVLSSLMERLMSGNLDIVQAQAQYRQAQAALKSSRSEFFPTIGTSASVTRSGSGSGSASGSSGSGYSGDGNVGNQYSLSGSVSWEVDLWGRVRRSVEASQSGLQASAADVATVRLSMASTLAQTYFNLRAADAELRLLQQTVQAYDRSLTTTRNRYDAGVAGQVDVESARTQLENARVQLEAAQSDRAQLEHAIAVLLGVPPASFSLPETHVLVAVPQIPVGLPAQLLQRRPDVAAAERRAAQANAEIGVAQAAWFPDLTLSAQGGFRSGEFAQWLTAPARFWSLGPALALTIFDGGARSAQVEQARAAYDAQAAAYRQSVLTALREVEDYLVALSALAREQLAQDRALEAARTTLRLTQNQYDAGLIDYLSVVQVQTTALSAERSALQMQASRLVASVQLIAALGGGWTGSYRVNMLGQAE